MMHIHWRVRVGQMRAPFAVGRCGTWGNQRYRCRCGKEWERYERRLETSAGWREVPPSG